MCAKDEKTSADEIEVTPEMIEAGARVIMDYLPDDPLMSPGLAEDLAEKILCKVHK